MTALAVVLLVVVVVLVVGAGVVLLRLRSRLTSAEQARVDAVVRAEQAEATLASTTETLSAAREALASSTSERVSVQAQLLDANAELETARRQREEARVELDRTKLDFTASQQELEAAQQSLARVQAALIDGGGRSTAAPSVGPSASAGAGDTPPAAAGSESGAESGAASEGAVEEVLASLWALELMRQRRRWAEVVVPPGEGQSSGGEPGPDDQDLASVVRWTVERLREEAGGHIDVKAATGSSDALGPLASLAGSLVAEELITAMARTGDDVEVTVEHDGSVVLRAPWDEAAPWPAEVVTLAGRLGCRIDEQRGEGADYTARLRLS